MNMLLWYSSSIYVVLPPILPFLHREWWKIAPFSPSACSPGQYTISLLRILPPLHVAEGTDTPHFRKLRRRVHLVIGWLGSDNLLQS